METKIPQNTEKNNTVKERYCIVQRENYNAEDMLRFVVDPQGVLIPDIKAKLPGRGAWVFGQNALVKKAIEQKAFARSFKRPVKVPEDLLLQVDNLLMRAALSNLSLARRSGAIITGASKVDTAIRNGKVDMVFHACDAAHDGKRKIAQAIYAFENNLNRENNLYQTKTRPIKVFSPFKIDQMQLAFGDQNVVHFAIMKDRGAESFIKSVLRLIAYRNNIENGTQPNITG